MSIYKKLLMNDLKEILKTYEMFSFSHLFYILTSPEMLEFYRRSWDDKRITFDEFIDIMFEIYRNFLYKERVLYSICVFLYQNRPGIVFTVSVNEENYETVVKTIAQYLASLNIPFVEQRKLIYKNFLKEVVTIFSLTHLRIEIYKKDNKITRIVIITPFYENVNAKPYQVAIEILKKVFNKKLSKIMKEYIR